MCPRLLSIPVCSFMAQNYPGLSMFVKYTDGDEEDFNEDEMKSGRKLYLSVLHSNIV